MPSRARRPPRAAAAPTRGEDDVRGRVLAASVKLIDKGGLSGLSMREVARAAGVSHQAPYHYFPDREAIFAALAEEGFKTLALRLQETTEDMDVAATDRFVAAGRTYVEFACDHPALFRIMFRPDVVDIDRFPEARACGDRAFALLPKVVQECIAEGLPPDPSAQALMVLGWSVAHGLACLLLDGPLHKVLPQAAAARDELIRDVMAAMRGMLLASAKSARTSKRSSRSRRRS